MSLLDKFKFSLPPLPTSPPAHSPDRQTLLLLSAVILVAVIVHFSIASLIVALFGLMVWSLKTALIIRSKENPSRIMIMLLTISSLALILINYGGWNGQKAGISFLVLLVALKFLESKTLRDYYVVCLMLFFLASSSFLFNSSLSSILMVVVYTIAVTAMLLKISNPTSTKLSRELANASVIILKALPLAVLLFFLFPRIQGNFGFLPSQDEAESDNQLNDSLVAGDLAGSAFNNSLAFRVEFDGATPAFRDRYWRAKVMTSEQNFQWEVTRHSPEELRRAKRKSSQNQSKQPTADASNYSYRIIHEPSTDNYVPFLDYVLDQKIGVKLDDHSVYLAQNNAGSFAYDGASTRLPNIVDSADSKRAKLLTTLATPKSRSLALTRKWRQQASNQREIVDLALQHFAQQEFYYSLEPPTLEEDPLDEFLFETKTGYCEHYASAFTILMRWMGIPARVVVGYQGGSQNIIGNYIEVRYSDAHAWSEVWIDGRWQRVDPTAAINPARIEYGMEAWLNQLDAQGLGNNASGRALANYLNPQGVEKLLRQFKDTWKNVGYQWNKWVINYNFDSQKNLLAGLGFEHRNSLYTLLGLLFAGTMGLMLFYFWQLIPKAVQRGEAQQIYLRFVKRFKTVKLEKSAADSPNEFADKAIQLLPNDSEQITAITKAYIDLRYSKHGGSIDAFKQQVKEFKLQKPTKQ